MPVSESMKDLIRNDIERLRSAIRSKHISVHKELYDYILQTYDSVVPRLTDGLEDVEKSIETSSILRKKSGIPTTRLNSELLQTNLSRLANKLQAFLDDDGEVELFEDQPSIASQLRAEYMEESAKSPAFQIDQLEIVSNIDIAIDTVSKRRDLTQERRDEFMQVLEEIKTAIEYESDKKERWKLIRPLLSWAYNQTDPSIASDMLFLLSEAIR